MKEKFLGNIFFSVIPAILGLTLALILAIAACFCARRVRRQNKKSFPEVAFPFQPPSRPTRAVRSPTGATSHYLKKSPSPTSSAKPLPGSLSLSPTAEALPPPPKTFTTKYSEDNEMSGASTSNNEHQVDENDGEEFGRLGTLVFKLRYLAERNALVVSIVRCRGLPSRIQNGTLVTESGNVGQLQSNGRVQPASAMDPYIKLQLLPDKQHKVKTRQGLKF